MIIIKLQGGLGNQLFQYAFGMFLANKLGVNLKIDNRYYLSDKKRIYKLDNFNISGEIATDKDIENLTRQNIFQKIFHIENKHIFKEPDFHYFCPEASGLSDDIYAEGFWQKEKYFEDISDIIRKEFTLKKSLPNTANSLLESIDKNNSISVHIRRGDYTQEKYKKIFHECTLEYYRKSISLIKEKLINPHFFVFSDDIEWAKTLPLPENTVLVDSSFSLQDYEELIIMSKCKHNIIANSTFSWWGAWLNSNQEKIVIGPKKWFADKNIKEEDLTPKTWTKI